MSPRRNSSPDMARMEARAAPPAMSCELGRPGVVRHRRVHCIPSLRHQRRPLLYDAYHILCWPS